MSPTIAAIATGTQGGIGIVRVSGPLAEPIGRGLCTPWPEDLHSHHLYLGAVRDGQGRAVDRVLFTLMRAPRSYTGEDVLEIHGHGGAVNLSRILDRVLSAGAVLAQPGEFTRRAFLGGKLDLVQAEAVAALIGAQCQQAAAQSQRQLAGELGQVIQELRQRLVRLLGEVDGALDFPDATEDDAVLSLLVPGMEAVRQRLQGLLQGHAQGGRAIGEGLILPLLGCTNAGKSSLINALCGTERVLVDARPGTTRDVVEVSTSWSGMAVTLIDMAGEHEGQTSLERLGRRLGHRRSRDAHMTLLVVDATVGLGPADRRVLANLPAGHPFLVVWSKVDHHHAAPPPPHLPVVSCSALCGWGLMDLRERVLAQLAPRRDEDAVLVTNARHAAALAEGSAALGRALEAVQAGLGLDVVGGELRSATLRLGAITGEDVSADVVDAIFSRFCIGK